MISKTKDPGASPAGKDISHKEHKERIEGREFLTVNLGRSRSHFSWFGSNR